MLAYNCPMCGGNSAVLNCGNGVKIICEHQKALRLCRFVVPGTSQSVEWAVKKWNFVVGSILNTVSVGNVTKTVDIDCS